jgi:hypothetical protein
MMTQDEVLKELRSVIATNQQFTTWTISTPHIVELVNRAIKQERETILKYANSDEFNRSKGENSPYAFELTKWIEARGNT